MKKTIILFILAILFYPLTGYAEEPVLTEGFIEITEDVLDKFYVLEDSARNSNFNQFRNPVLQQRFDEIRTVLAEYDKFASKNVHNWPDGQQKEIASELHATNFHFRAYSLSQYNKFMQAAEKSLTRAQSLFRDYVSHM